MADDRRITIYEAGVLFVSTVGHHRWGYEQNKWMRGKAVVYKPQRADFSIRTKGCKIEEKVRFDLARFNLIMDVREVSE